MSRRAFKKRVAVYDTKSSELRRVSLRDLEKLDLEFEVLIVPRFGRFDLYESNQDAEERSHIIISQQSQIKSGIHLRARIKYGGLGHLSNAKRMFSSKHRQLLVGALQE